MSVRRTETPYLPPYFRTMERYYREGAPLLHAPPVLLILTVPELVRLQKDGYQILDIRAPAGFAGGHIPGSLSLWRGGISSYAGWFLKYKDPNIIINDYNQNRDQVTSQLFRMGYDKSTGILAGGMGAWYISAGEIGTIGACSVQVLKEQLDRSTPFLLDVRDIRNRRAIGHIRNSHHIHVRQIPDHIHEIPVHEPVFVYCDAGYKASLAAGILARYRILTLQMCSAG